MLIFENYTRDVILESEGGNYWVVGTCAVSNMRNRNGRIYDTSLLESAINQFDSERVKTKTALGELQHSNVPETDVTRVSHLTTEVTRIGENTWSARSKVLDTEMGRIVKSILAEGGAIGYSTKGRGSVGSDGLVLDYSMDQIDLVLEPSTGIYATGLMESETPAVELLCVSEEEVWRALRRFIA